MTVVIPRKLITVGELWFDEEAPVVPVDVLLYYHWSRPMDPTYTQEFHSITIGLDREPGRLLAAMKKSTRYEIARAEKRDALTHELWTAPDADVVDRFCAFFDAFAAERGVSPANRSWLDRYAAAGRLAISWVAGEGRTLVWHSYYHDGRWARLLQSASVLHGAGTSAGRAFVGRANRYHHWRDILQFKQRGVAYCDLGGWYEGRDDPRRLGINRFKEEFGGRVERCYYSMKPLTILGRLFLWAQTAARREFLHMM